MAGIEPQGDLIRLYPVPFRLIQDNGQFKKWQWIEARIEKAKNDYRPESHKVFVDTIKIDGQPIPTVGNWKRRREAIGNVRVFSDFALLDRARTESGITLGIVKPAAVLGFDIAPADRPEWTKEETAKLLQLQGQGDLLGDEARNLATLRKLPFDFYYRYSPEATSPTTVYRHKIVDWEMGALFWNLRRSHGAGWEAPFREKMEHHLPSRDLMFLMGTIHRFPDQWLIVSVLYPPRPPVETQRQGSLFDL